MLLSGTLQAQSYRFASYTPEMGLPGKFVYNIIQDNDGFIWVGTGSGMARFDGYEFYPVILPDSTISGYPVCSYKDSKGLLWFGYSDGTVLYNSGKELKRISGIKAFRINNLTEMPDGAIVAVTQTKGLYIIDPASHKVTGNIVVQGNKFLNVVRFTENDRFFAGTHEGVIECRIEGEVAVIEREIPGIEYQKVEALYLSPEGLIIAGTDDNGLFLLKKGGSSMVKAGGPEWFGYTKIQEIKGDGNKGLWISTFGLGLIHVADIENPDSAGLQVFNKSAGLPGDNVKTIFSDREGNMWVGLYGDGLSMLSSEAFTFIAPGKRPIENDIIFIGRKNNKLILGTRMGYHLFNPESGMSERWVDLKRVSSVALISAYHIDAKGILWLGTDGDGLWRSSDWQNFNKAYSGSNSGENIIASIDSDGNNIWLATNDGAIVLSKETLRVKDIFTTRKGLSHNSIRQVRVRPDGRAFIITESDKVYICNPGEPVTTLAATIAGPMQNKMESLGMSGDGKIWVGTKGNGLFQVEGAKTVNFTSNDGLLNDYIYSVLADKGGNIWIGHQRGFSILRADGGSIRTIGTEFAGNGDCNHNSLFEDVDGRVYIGTSAGLIVYNGTKENKEPPATLMNITSVEIDDRKIDPEKKLVLPYRSRYIVKITYSGINFSYNSRIRYISFLDDFDREWTVPGSSRSIVYRLTSGNYTFRVKAVDENGHELSGEGLYSFVIRKPVWRMWWFILLVLAIIGSAIIIIFRIREDAARKRRVELEEELSRRTQEVMRQNEEIEQKNREITDSINYARRIQSSILPDFERVKTAFPEAFMIYMPKQIVSGDFYWFEKVDEDNFILICADSTGHGVPGAFMSMIGSALIQDIVRRRGVRRPSEILTLLDNEVTSTLNQNSSADGGASDGMDIVVCNFNTKTRHLLFSSAMRPVILVMGGDSYYIKGNRSSVGGDFVGEKLFDDQEYYLSEGDSIYLFSDGYPDQFGGPEGKKMKIIRVKALLEKISSETMDVQSEKVERAFLEWKGKLEQVDDVLIMGIRF